MKIRVKPFTANGLWFKDLLSILFSGFVFFYYFFALLSEHFTIKLGGVFLLECKRGKMDF